MSLGFSSVNDSIYSTTFGFKDSYVSVLSKLFLKEENGSLNIILLKVDTISYNPDSDLDKEIIQNINKSKCLDAYKNQYIPDLTNSITNCLKVDSLYVSALRLSKDNEFEKAYVTYQEITNTKLRENDNFNFEKYSALNRMAFIKIQQTQFDKAIQLFDKALSIEPWWLNLKNRTQFRTNGKLPYWVKENYVEELESQYEYNSENTEQLLIHANFALAYIKTGKLKEANEMLQSAEQLYPNEPYLKKIKDLYDIEKNK